MHLPLDPLKPHAFQSVMAYSKWSRDHEHILPRTVHLPAWGALTIPYRWMLKESGFQLAQELELDAHPDREPDEPTWLANTSWIQGFSNQEALLEGFATPLVEQQTLVLFYTTRTPLVDDERRVILGAALLEKKPHLVFTSRPRPRFKRLWRAEAIPRRILTVLQVSRIIRSILVK
jgi:hypothetical protein